MSASHRSRALLLFNVPGVVNVGSDATTDIPCTPLTCTITNAHAQALEDTVDNVHRIMASQSDLKAACETIEAYQAELDNDLAALSENLDLELEALQLQVRVSVRCASMRV
jgi:hypothetical protein